MPLDHAGTHYQGKNFAPVEPLASAKASIKDPKDNPSSLNAVFREHFEEAKYAYDEEFREMIEQARVIQNLGLGKLVMKRDMGGTGYVFFKPIASRASDRSNWPVFPQNREILKSKWMKSRPMMEAQAFGDGYRVEQALNSVNLLVKNYFRRIFEGPENFYESDEFLSASDYGGYITQFYYDDRLNQIRQAIPIIQNENKVIVPGFGGCHGCGFQGHPDDFSKTGATYPQCPECGGFKTTKMVGDAMAEVPQIVGMDEIVQGDINGRLLNYGACRFDPHGFPHQSDRFLYSEYVPLNLATNMFGQDLDLQPGESDDLGLQLLDSLAAHGGNIENLGENDHYKQASNFTNRVPMHSLWLEPSMYAGTKLKEAERTLGGTIPADVDLAEIFPEGVCVVGFEDFRLQVGLFAEQKNIASACYLTVSSSGIGKGLSDGVDIAKDMNEIHSMAMAGLKRLGASGIVVDGSTGITQETVRNMFRPNKATFVDLKESGVDDIRKAVTQLQLNPVNPVLPQYAVQLNNLINIAMMTGDFAQGMTQDVDINTLGGQQLAHGKAEEAKGGILTGKVFHRMQSAGIITKLARKHNQLPRFYAHGEDTVGASRGRMISGTDLPETIDFRPVTDSELPVNSAERKMAAREFVEKSGGMMQVVQAAMTAPKETAYFMEQYGIKLPSLDTNAMRVVCLDRVDEIKQLANIYPDPNEIIARMRKGLKIDEPLHILKAEFIASMLDDDEADEWSPIVLATVQLLVDTHYTMEAEAMLKKQMLAANAQMALEGEMMKRQQEMMRPQMEEQAAAAEQEQVMGVIGDAAGRYMDEEAAEAQHGRDMERDEAAGARTLNTEREKAKLKPAPVAKK